MVSENFKILCWKHLIVRKRRYCITILEFLVPIGLFIYLYAQKDNAGLGQRRSAHGNAEMLISVPETLKLDDAEDPHFVIFTPSNKVTMELIESVASKLDLPEIQDLNMAINKGKGGQISRGYCSISDLSLITNETLSKMKDKDAIVIFDIDWDSWDSVVYKLRAVAKSLEKMGLPQVSNHTDLPKDFKYTIRMKRRFMTGLDYSLDEEFVPHQSFATIYEPYMALQWAIDSSFLELLTGNEIPQRVTLQEFPFVFRSGASGAIIPLVGLAVRYGLIITFGFLIARVATERLNGAQMLLKMTGMSSKLMILVNFLDTLPAMLVFSLTGTLILKMGDPAILRHTDGSLLFFSMFFHSFTVYALAILFSYVIRSESYVMVFAFLTFVVFAITSMVLTSVIPVVGHYVVGLFYPFFPIIWITNEMSALEMKGAGMSWSTVATAYSPEALAPIVALVYMLIQVALFLLLAWYLDNVCPGKHDIAKPWNFCCKRKNDIKPKFADDDTEQAQIMARDQQFFEPKPANAVSGIKIVKVTKSYGNFRVLNNVSLSVYRGELTVLLGPNGAGKTTIMSIMTGTLTPNKGQVLVNGRDIAQHPSARNQIGFCPQHNVFLSKLNVIEHVVIFARLRGQSKEKAWKTSRALLDELGLKSKAQSLGEQLSGGMKRRLQLACALAGDADVLVLDEPSSGLDVETRRSLWDLVLSLRGKRTVLISTHFMEEADALADRIAAINGGLLRCHGTPMFLKRAVGAGYRLTLMTSGEPSPALAEAVRSSVPAAEQRGAAPNSATFALPAADAPAFPKLFGDLEARKKDLGIESIGVGVSTLEDVFMAICDEKGPKKSDSLKREPTYKRMTGFCLCLRQFWALFKRQFFFIGRSKISFAIIHVILPIVIMALVGVYMVNKKAPPGLDKDPVRAMDARRFPQRARVLAPARDAPALRARYPYVDVETEHDVAGFILRTGKRHPLEYQAYLAGLELNDTDAKVLFPTTVRHAAPAALSVLSNALAARLAAPASLTAYNHPLQGDDHMGLTMKMAKTNILSIMTFILLVNCVMVPVLLSAASLPVAERVSGARALHVMAGASPELYWFVPLFVRTLLFVIFVLVPFLIVAAFDQDETFNEPQFMMAISTLLILGAMANLAFLYFLSFFLNTTILNLVIIILLIPNLLCMLLANTTYARWVWVIVYLFLPLQPLMHSMLLIGGMVVNNATCNLNRHLCPFLTNCCGQFKDPLTEFLGIEPTRDDVEGNIIDYFEVGKYKTGSDMLMLLCHFLVYMTLVCLAQRGLFSRCNTRLKGRRYEPPPLRYSDRKVLAEAQHVEKAIENPHKSKDTMLVSDVHKQHGCCKRFTAVRGISLSVKKGECVGLLGVNGAGKTTLFNVLTAETWPTRGSVYAGKHFRSGLSTKYVQQLGYCPQFFGLDMFLTGRRNLMLLQALRGLNKRDAAKVTESWIKVVGLEMYANRVVSGYSGGCQRRLAAAGALSTGGALTVLDEPTSGVDVLARRRVWDALRRGLNSQRAVIISSHSMDEMETLCDRIAVVAGGELCAVGAAAALRADHAQGHALLVKLRAQPLDEITTSKRGSDSIPKSKQRTELKAALERTFNCTLKDEHMTMLHYHINEQMPYSQLFSEMEKLKEQFKDYMEDYSITETTLEEVFLAFAKRHDELTGVKVERDRRRKRRQKRKRREEEEDEEEAQDDEDEDDDDRRRRDKKRGDRPKSKPV